MKVKNLKINHLTNPIGYRFDYVTASWVTESKIAKKQTAAQVIVSLDENFKNLVYDSGKDPNANSLSYVIPIEVEARSRYFWKVVVWNEKDEHVESKTAFFETGKMGEAWIGQWITPDLETDVHPLLRKEFTLTKKVKQARAYVTGLGIYELEINGSKVGDEFLMPGSHAYDFWVQYQTYDITNYLQIGENAVGSTLGNGWFKGRFGFDDGYHNLYGDRYYFICELRILFEDGSEKVISTDNTWKSHASNVLTSSIYDGEVIDARLLPQNWSIPNFDDSKWTGTLIQNPKKATNLQERLSPPIVIVEERKAVDIIITPKEEVVLDFGQIITGWVSFKSTLPAGKMIKLQYGEILQDGCFYRDNLRTAKAEFVYTSNGNEEIVRPHFTFYGFRYVKVVGIEKINIDDFIACVVMSQMEETGRIETSNPYVNKLVENALWSQKGNFLDVPTDCPQRDERMGWTGDAQIFSGTACFNMYTPAFFRKYMQDLNFEQTLLDGSVPHIVPRIKLSHSDGFIDGHGASPWGDAAVIIPWTLYMHYGDKELLSEHYPGMKAWVDYIIKQDKIFGDKKLWLTGFHFADWLALDNKEQPHSPLGATDSYYIASVFYYYSTSLLAKAAKVLSLAEDMEYYEEWAKEIRKAIQAEYFSPNGRSTINTQTALITALFFNLLPLELEQRVGEDLLAKIKSNNMHLDTGFVGTPYICRALSKIGADDFAYRLLLNDDYPSWLYAIKMGATTIWERWNSVLPDGKISGSGMNSLNHYAYGSIVEWIYRDVCGLNPTEDFPGFKKVVICPHPNGRLKRAYAEVNTASGKYCSGWEILADGSLTYQIEIPFDCEAEIIFPDVSVEKIFINNNPLDLEQKGKDVKAIFTSGIYEIAYSPDRDYKHRYSLIDSMETLLGNEETNAVLNKYAKGVFENKADMVEVMKKQSAEAFFSNYQLFQYYEPTTVGDIQYELEQIEVPVE